MKFLDVAVASFFLFVAKAGLVLGSCSCPDPAYHEPILDVVIIGAGMAGVKAAHRLSEYDVRYLVLEATEDVGGRMKKATFGGHTVELGANWIEGGSQNPILEIAWQNSIDYDKQFFDDWVTFRGDGTPIRNNDVNKEFNNLRRAMQNCLRKEADAYYESRDVSRDGMDRSAAEVLADECRWDPSTPLQEVIDWFGTNFEFTFNGEDVSLASFPDDTFRDFNRQRYLVFDEDGYQKVAQVLADELTVPDELTTPIEYGTTVTCVDVESSPQVIFTHKTNDPSDCTVYQAEKVISTVSMGVLAQKPSLFVPPIDRSDKNVFEMGLYYKVFYQFTEKFWGNSEFISIVNEDKAPGYCGLWQNLDTPWFLPGSKILFCTITTELIKDDGTVPFTDEEVLEPLYAAFGVSGDLLDNGPLYYNWKQDEYTHGSYANWIVGGQLDDYYDYFKPLTDSSDTPKVYLSGTCSCFRYWEFVHGAYEAGLRSANQVLRDLGENVDVTSICDQGVENWLPVEYEPYWKNENFPLP